MVHPEDRTAVACGDERTGYPAIDHERPAVAPTGEHRATAWYATEAGTVFCAHIPDPAPKGTPRHVRLRLRLPEGPSVPASTVVYRVSVKEDGRVVAQSDIRADVSANTPRTTAVLNHRDTYGEVYACGWRRGSGPVTVTVEHSGSTPAYLDYVAIDDPAADALFSGRRNGQIDAASSQFISYDTNTLLAIYTSLDPNTDAASVYILERLITARPAR
ncbi:MAG: hypothetical protein HY962_02185 [Ignavibacteriae bacterium]|nr:hypothetical protein [Ignavibacteriota bacterium]